MDALHNVKTHAEYLLDVTIQNLVHDHALLRRIVSSIIHDHAEIGIVYIRHYAAIILRVYTIMRKVV